MKIYERSILCRKIDSSTREGRFLTGLGYIALPNKVLSEAGGEFKLRIKNLRTYQLNGLLFYAHGDGGKVQDCV